MPSSLTDEDLSILSPYLEGHTPNEAGEVGLHCPFHQDRNRSASLNVNKDVWFCQKCNIGGDVEDLIGKILFDAGIQNGNGYTPGNSQQELFKRGEEHKTRSPISERDVETWTEALLANKTKLKAFQKRRGLSVETIKRFQLGWNAQSRAYTIPVRALTGELANVRYYQLDPDEGRRKIWGLTGRNEPRLYPVSQLDDHSELVITEGELDALITIQNGFPAITRTAAAGVWKRSWSELFSDKSIFIVQDMDSAGQAGAAKILEHLRGIAREVRVVRLPYDETEDHGDDLTDYFVRDGHSPQDFKDLLYGVTPEVRDPAVVEKEFVEASVLDSFAASQSGKRMRMAVTIIGKKNPPYLVPADIRYSCTQDAGAKCNLCPMQESYSGHTHRHVGSHEPLVLEMLSASARQVHELLRDHISAQKCTKLLIEPTEMRSVEELYVRPSVDQRSHEADGDYTNRKIISVGRHDTLPNNTVEVVGTIYPNPRDQHNEFQAWEVTQTETSIDRFDLMPEVVSYMKEFRPEKGQRPLDKAFEIAEDLAHNVTRIYGRPEMHVLMDLVYHSALSFQFGNDMIHRGWLEALIVGDTRTGKSEAASRLAAHYAAGEVVSCESATFAGIVGGLQQMGKEWEVTWGTIPINDRRLVTLDEVSGLQPEQIAQMSSIRSSGEAQLTKIRSERTWARTRLLWLGNPRNGRMSDYTYGVHAIKPLVGNNEDIARFDLAMSVGANEVRASEINREHIESALHAFPTEWCQALVRWVWSRSSGQISWGAGSEQAVYDGAIQLGKKFVEDPPLIQSANVRVKIARVAVALACRTFSTDRTYERLLVTRTHVQDAIKFIELIYSMPNFGYRETSAEYLADLEHASKHRDEAKRYLVQHPGLSKFLRGTHGSFRKNDLEDMLNMSRDESTGVVNTLYKFRMVRRTGANIKVEPTLHELLREVRE